MLTKRFLFQILIANVVLFISVGVNAQTTGPIDRFDAARKAILDHPAFKRSSISWSFRDIATGQELDAFESKRLMIPASTVKVFTTALALNNLRSEYRFETKIGVLGKIKKSSIHGDLIIQGGGDPSFGSGLAGAMTGDSVLNIIANMLRDSGITKIKGNLIIDPFFWPYDHSVIPRKWIWEDIGNYYGAGAWGLNWRSNEFSVSFKAGKERIDTVKACILSPWAKYLKLDSKVHAEYQQEQEIYLYSAPFSTTVFADGIVEVGSEASVERASLPDPPRAFGLELKQFLEARGIEIKGDVLISDTRNQSSSLWKVILSPPLRDLVFETNQKSNNLFAECIAKKMAINQINRTAYPTGKMLEIKLNEYSPYADSALFLVDGCGLSRNNQISTSFQSRFMSYQTKSTDFGYFMASLPQAGEEGTMKNFPKIAQLRAKTGSMDKVRAYTGYFYDQNNHWIAFSLIANHVPLSNPVLKNMMAELIAGATEKKFELPFPFAPSNTFRDTLNVFPEIIELKTILKQNPNDYFDLDEPKDTTVSITISGEPDVNKPYFFVRVEAGGNRGRVKYSYRFHAQTRFAERWNPIKNEWEMICWGELFMKR